MYTTPKYEVWIYDDSMSSLGYPASEGILKRGLTKAEAKCIARHNTKMALRYGVDISYYIHEEGDDDGIS